MNKNYREFNAAFKIQNFMRKAVELRKNQKKKRQAQAASKIQALVRGFLVRRHIKHCLNAAIIIQAHFRGFLVRKQYYETK